MAFSSYLLLRVSLDYSPKYQTTRTCWKWFGLQGGGFVASNSLLVSSSPPCPWFFGELLASFWKCFPSLFNIVCTAVILSCTYLPANWFPVSSNPVSHGSHWHSFEPKSRTDRTVLGWWDLWVDVWVYTVATQWSTWCCYGKIWWDHCHIWPIFRSWGCKLQQITCFNANLQTN